MVSIFGSRIFIWRVIGKGMVYVCWVLGVCCLSISCMLVWFMSIWCLASALWTIVFFGKLLQMFQNGNQVALIVSVFALWN